MLIGVACPPDEAVSDPRTSSIYQILEFLISLELVESKLSKGL
jgi:hypothetical protein